MREVKTIEDIAISVEWENDKAFLVFFNRGLNSELIGLLCVESGSNSSEIWMNLQLFRGEKKRVQLPEEFVRWEKFGFRIKGKNSLASTIELTKLLDNIKLQHETEKLASNQEPTNNVSASPEKSSNSSGQDLQIASPLTHKKVSIPKPSKSEQSVLVKSTHEKSDDQQIAKLQAQNVNLEQMVAERQKEIDSFKKRIVELSHENSELKRQLKEETDAMSTDPEHVFREAAHHVLQTLFEQHQKDVDETLQNPIQISNGIEAEIKRFEKQFDRQMIYALSVVKEHITKVKGLIRFELSESFLPENQPEQLAKLILTGEPPSDVQFPYLGELGKAYWNDLKAYTTKLPQVIVEIQTLLHRIVIQLLDGFSPYRAKNATEVQMARRFYKDYLPNILQMMNLELVPIEIEQTEADSRIHDIQGSQRGAYQRGVVADIIQHGVRRISDKQIIKKPVVMRGEPE